MVDSEEILKMCGSLVRLDTNAEGQNDMGDDAQVQSLTAAHSSVIDFLRTQPIKIGSDEVSTFSTSKANLRMAETCLIYLLYFIKKGITLNESNITSYPFARLSALIWHKFYREILASCEQVDMTRLNGLVLELFSSPTAMLNWVKLSNPDNVTERVNFEMKLSQVKPTIYYAARLGLPDIIRTLIQEGSPVDELVGPPFGTPLVAACAMGNIDTASLLLAGGADPNLSGHFLYGTPLVAAIEFDWIEIVRFLLKREDIDINGRCYPRIEATKEVLDSIEEYIRLQEKLRKNENEYARCINIGIQLMELANGPNIGDLDINLARRSYPRSKTLDADSEKQPRHYAQCIDTEGCNISDNLDEAHYQSFLARATAALNKITRSTESMVYIAVEEGNLEILEVLLAAGADPNVRGGAWGTALQNACAFGDEKVVRILLKYGAGTDVYGGRYGSSLNVACRYGSIQIVEDLIKAGTNVNRHGKPPLG